MIWVHKCTNATFLYANTHLIFFFWGGVGGAGGSIIDVHRLVNLVVAMILWLYLVPSSNLGMGIVSVKYLCIRGVHAQISL